MSPEERRDWEREYQAEYEHALAVLKFSDRLDGQAWADLTARAERAEAEVARLTAGLEHEWRVVYRDGRGEPVVWSRNAGIDDARRGLATARNQGWPTVSIQTRAATDWSEVPDAT